MEPTLSAVVAANGDSELMARIEACARKPKTNPPVIFRWGRVTDFIAHVAAAAATGPLGPAPVWLPPEALADESALKGAIINHVRVPSADDPLGTTALPCSMSQFGQVVCNLTQIMSHPWIQAVVAAPIPANLAPFPLATVYVPRARSNILDVAFRDPPMFN